MDGNSAKAQEVEKRKDGGEEVLDDSELHFLLTLTDKATPQWKKLGLELGFTHNDLQKIEHKPLLMLEGTEGYYRELIAQWLEWAPPNHKLPTVQALSCALKNVGQERVAYELEKAKGTYTPTSIQCVSFGEIRTLATEQPEMGTSPEDTAVTKICTLEGSYKVLIASAEELVKQKGVNEFRRNLTLLPTRMQDREENLKRIQKYRSEIYHAETIEEIFGLLNLCVWNYMNYYLLQYIIQVYGNREINKTMEVYVTAVEEFKSETTLRVFLNIQSSKRCPKIPDSLRDELKEVMFEHQTLTLDSSLADVDRFRQEITDEYFLLEFVVILAGIKKGSVTTLWLVPPAVATAIMERLKQGNTDFLLKHEITELRIDGITIYPLSQQSSQIQNIDMISALLDRGVPHIAIAVLSHLDAKQLIKAEQVCLKWWHIISNLRLWKKLIATKVERDPVWKAISQEREWLKYLSQGTPPQSTTDNFYRQLYYSISRDIHKLHSNWKSGHYRVSQIQTGSAVNALQYDSQKIISAHDDFKIRIWDKSTGKCKTVLKGHHDWAIALHYDDNIIISGGATYDPTIRVWDIHTGDNLNTIWQHKKTVLSLKFNSTTLVTASKDTTVALWKIVSPKLIILTKLLDGHKGTVNAVDMTPDYFVSGSDDMTVKVWDYEGRLIRTLEGHTGWVRSVQANEKYVVSGSGHAGDDSIRIWENVMEAGTCIRQLSTGHINVIRGIAFDETKVVSGSHDWTLKIYDFQAALKSSSPDDQLCLATLTEHTNLVWCVEVDALQIISGSESGDILIHNFLDPEPAVVPS